MGSAPGCHPIVPANSWLTLGTPAHRKEKRPEPSKRIPPGPAHSAAAHTGLAWTEKHSHKEKTKTLSLGVYPAASLLDVPTPTLAKSDMCMSVALKPLLGSTTLPALLLGPVKGP